jgi:hypothetical protein
VHSIDHPKGVNDTREVKKKKKKKKIFSVVFAIFFYPQMKLSNSSQSLNTASSCFLLT